MSQNEGIANELGNAPILARIVISVALLSGIGTGSLALVQDKDTYTATQARGEFALIHERLDTIKEKAERDERRLDFIAANTAPSSLVAQVDALSDWLHRLELEIARRRDQ